MELTRFIKKLVLLLPIPMLILGLNYCVDPQRIFEHKTEEYYQEIANILLSGKHVANISASGERILQKCIIDGLSTTPDVIVLGSSRAKGIGSSAFPDRSFFNHAIDGASLEDDVAIYEMYRKKGRMPKTVVLSLDAWLLGPSIPPSQLSRALWASQQLMSLSYFQESLSYLRRGKTNAWYATSDTIVDDTLKLADGSVIRGIESRSRSVSAVNSLVLAKNQSGIDYLKPFSTLQTDRFERFIDLLIQDGVNVVFFLPAYHPLAYPVLIKNDLYKLVATERYFNDFAKRKAIRLIGSYDPNRTGLKDVDFYDDGHMKEESLNRNTTWHPPLNTSRVDSVQPSSDKVTILCYHTFSGRPGLSCDFSVREFRHHIQLLQKKGVSFITVDQLKHAQYSGQKNVLLVFDDGHKTGYKAYKKVLKPLGIKPVFAIYSRIRDKGLSYATWNDIKQARAEIMSDDLEYPMTWDQVREVMQDGCEIASHGWGHCALTSEFASKNPTEFSSEIEHSKAVLEDRLKTKIRFFVYPDGVVSVEAETMLKKTGYQYAFSTKKKPFEHHIDNPYDIGRFVMDRSHAESVLNSI